MSIAADDIAAFTAADDALVLASVSSPAEIELLDDWLRRQCRDHPATHVTVLHLPAGNPPPEVVSQLVRELESSTTDPWCRCESSGCPTRGLRPAPR